MKDIMPLSTNVNDASTCDYDSALEYILTPNENVRSMGEVASSSKGVSSANRQLSSSNSDAESDDVSFFIKFNFLGFFGFKCINCYL